MSFESGESRSYPCATTPQDNLKKALTPQGSAPSSGKTSAVKSAPVVLSDGDKGGIGKSFLGRILTYLFSLEGIDWAGFDMDPRNSHLCRFHSNSGVVQLDWTDDASWDSLYAYIVRLDPSCVSLIDLPAQAGAVLAREYPRCLATANHVRRPLVRFWTLSPEFDSVNLLSQSLGSISLANTFVVKNLRNASRADFGLWDQSNTRARFLAGGGTELHLPSLANGVGRAIEANDISFFEATARLQEPWFVCDIESFLAEVHREFTPLIERFT